MGMSLGSSSGSGLSNSGRSSLTALAEINVTPLVDVMLVLLIVFMISAPLMQQGIQVDLPKANSPAMSEIPDQLILSIKPSRQIFLGEHAVPSGTLMNRLSAIVGSKPQIEILIQADQALNYGFIAQIMSEVKRAGIHRVGLVTQPGDSKVRL